MRTRVATTLALLALLLCLFTLPAHAQRYETPEPNGSEAAEEAPDEKEPKADATEEAEDGAAATPEAGPPWTYQMARLTVALVALLMVAIGLAYYRFVVRRQRGEV